MPEDQKITSAALEFTGLQNLMEPENNDILHINILQSNRSGPGLLITEIYEDDQERSNYFKNESNSDFTWIDGVSELGSYSDNNDVGYSVTGEYKIANWEKTEEHESEKIKGLKKAITGVIKVLLAKYRPMGQEAW